MAFNLPPGCSLRDIEGPPRHCATCPEPIGEDAEDDLCWQCRLDKEWKEFDKSTKSMKPISSHWKRFLICWLIVGVSTTAVALWAPIGVAKGFLAGCFTIMVAITLWEATRPRS